MVSRRFEFRGPQSTRGPAIVALGGGHGLAASLRALRHVSDHLTAVVTVADDGGSSGRLRGELGVLPPGDLRMALSALCDDGTWGRTWRDVLQHRFDSSGELNGHAVGNLLIVALWQLNEDPVAGLELVGRLLGAQGRVLPMSSVPLEIEADVTTLEDSDERTTIRGQSKVAVAPGRVQEVRLVPNDPPASPEAVAAIETADWVILGPGSWFTSVLVHLLVPELAAALENTSARRCITMNLSNGDTETTGFTAADHLKVIRQHAPNMRIDAVLADPVAVEDVGALRSESEKLGARLLLRQVRRSDSTTQHDPLRLAAAYRDVFDDVKGDVT
ncbi:MAG TPA: uridine diphosphate-N-acetylglucosamine-binding protein YvcK [Actinomycetales bacterium]|nr:uridine diphosphate-N-acetylglucosamine-binding protein YvcK [Actinomycetales bacterium]